MAREKLTLSEEVTITPPCPSTKTFPTPAFTPAKETASPELTMFQVAPLSDEVMMFVLGKAVLALVGAAVMPVQVPFASAMLRVLSFDVATFRLRTIDVPLPLTE